MEQSLFGPLRLVLDKKILQEMQTDVMVLPANGVLRTDAGNIIYFCRPTLSATARVANSIIDSKNKSSSRRHTVFFVTKKTMMCESVMSEMGVPEVEMKTLHLDLIALDRDVLSLELPDVYRNFVVGGDPSDLLHVATSLMKLQTLYGVIPKVRHVPSCDV